MKGDVIFLLCYVPTVGLPVLLTAEEEAVLCGSAILAAAASGLKVNRSIIFLERGEKAC